MKSEIWKEFELTGSVDSYLDYRLNINSSKEYDYDAYNRDVGEIKTTE